MKYFQVLVQSQRKMIFTERKNFITLHSIYLNIVPAPIDSLPPNHVPSRSIFLTEKMPVGFTILYFNKNEKVVGFVIATLYCI
jgi:hypothetical protein